MTARAAAALAVLLLHAGAVPARAQQGRGGGMGSGFLPAKIPPPAVDATTDAQLRARHQREAFGGILPRDRQPKTLDLVTTSTFIESAGVFTIVPKGAVIVVPEKLASWIVVAPGPKAKFQPWGAFLAANRSSVRTFEVSLDQAAGKAALDPARLDAARRTGTLVVAVCQGGAVSCPPPEPPKPLSR